MKKYILVTLMTAIMIPVGIVLLAHNENATTNFLGILLLLFGLDLRYGEMGKDLV